MTDSNKPTFVLGVGAQKAGTSWLCTQLNKQPSANMGFRKEYHIWDAVFSEFGATITSAVKTEGADKALMRLMQTHAGVYEQYFLHLINHETRITGDITPSYSMLSSENFIEIKERLINAGFSVKVVFLMRDPVERNWSALRMIQRNLHQKGVKWTVADCEERFEKFYKSQRMVKRTQYDKTVKALRTAFTPDELYFGFYETMFETQYLLKISDFLGIEANLLNISQKVNASKASALSDGLRNSCKNFYSDVYSYCGTEFPEVKRVWD